jgi:hypothetical protein
VRVAAARCDRGGRGRIDVADRQPLTCQSELRQRALAPRRCQCENKTVGNERDAELADTLAEVGRRVGQALTDAFERIRPTFDALAEAASRPEVRAVIERAEKVLRHRPCLCFCSRAHPADRGVCEVLDAVITGQYSSDLLGDVDVPLCAPCAAARAARQFAG